MHPNWHISLTNQHSGQHNEIGSKLQEWVKLVLKGKTVFVKGGFIGSNLAKRLLSATEDVTAIGGDNPASLCAATRSQMS